MTNYIDNISIYGMMNKYASIRSANSFYKTKNKLQVVVFGQELDELYTFDTINYMYMDNPPSDNSVKYSTMNDVISIVDPDIYFDKLPGKSNRELRFTVNKFRKIIKTMVLTNDNKSDVLDMIERWRYQDNGGKKYRWVEHAGIDKALVERYCNNEDNICDNCYGTVFYINDKCVGYSIIANKPSSYVNGYPKYNYLTRKSTMDSRNLTEYIDWYTFKLVNTDNKTFLIDWGCSSGGVLWYKTHKWKVYTIDKKYFWKVKNND